MYNSMEQSLLEKLRAAQPVEKIPCILLLCLHEFAPSTVRVIKSRKLRWAGDGACVGEGTGVDRILVGKPQGKRPLGRPRCRWEDNIKLDLREKGIDGTN
jgi:hypothetical protein